MTMVADDDCPHIIRGCIECILRCEKTGLPCVLDNGGVCEIWEKIKKDRK